MAERCIGISPEKQIDYGSNKRRYREIFGGKRNRWLSNYSDTPWAFKAREILINIVTEARRENKPGTLGEISEDVCISRNQLARAAGGLLSNKPMDRYNGESPRDFVLHTLQNYYQEKYCPKVEYSI